MKESFDPDKMPYIDASGEHGGNCGHCGKSVLYVSGKNIRTGDDGHCRFDCPHCDGALRENQFNYVFADQDEPFLV